VEAWIGAHKSAYLYVVKKNGGFAVKFTDEDGRLAHGADVDAVVDLMNELVKDRPDLIVVVTGGFADVCLSVLNKGYALQKIAVRPLFMGRFIVAAGDGLTDEAMFDYPVVSIKVGREATMAGDRVTNHYRMIEVLAWLTAMHQDAGP
jgi:trehalose-6-phosphatase